MLMDSRTRRRAARGFTLIELLIVIAILLALVALVVGFFIGTQDRAEGDLQRVQLREIERALDRFRLDMSRYPLEEEGLEALWSRNALEDPEAATRWVQYLAEPIREDRWGNPLIYRAPSEIRPGAPYDLISMGPDGEEGTEDDITNHDRLRGEDGEFDDLDFDLPDMQL